MWRCGNVEMRAPLGSIRNEKLESPGNPRIEKVIEIRKTTFVKYLRAL
jgi:hypothetical protein